jgi:hypothetical protein
MDQNVGTCHPAQSRGWRRTIAICVDESHAIVDRLLSFAPNPFYVMAGYSLRAVLHLERGDVDAAEHSVRDGESLGADPVNMGAVRCLIAVRAGAGEQVGPLLRSLRDAAALGTGTVLSAAIAAMALGERDVALQLLGRRIMGDLAPILVRLTPDLHALLDAEPFAPRRSARTLVWPLEAPMLSPAVFETFSAVHVQSGRPVGSGVTSLP